MFYPLSAILTDFFGDWFFNGLQGGNSYGSHERLAFFC